MLYNSDSQCVVVTLKCFCCGNGKTLVLWGGRLAPWFAAVYSFTTLSKPLVLKIQHKGKGAMQRQAQNRFRCSDTFFWHWQQWLAVRRPYIGHLLSQNPLRHLPKPITANWNSFTRRNLGPHTWSGVVQNIPLQRSSLLGHIVIASIQLPLYQPALHFVLAHLQWLELDLDFCKPLQSHVSSQLRVGQQLLRVLKLCQVTSLRRAYESWVLVSLSVQACGHGKIPIYVIFESTSCRVSIGRFRFTVGTLDAWHSWLDASERTATTWSVVQHSYRVYNACLALYASTLDLCTEPDMQEYSHTCCRTQLDLSPGILVIDHTFDCCSGFCTRIICFEGNKIKYLATTHPHVQSE